MKVIYLFFSLLLLVRFPTRCQLEKRLFNDNSLLYLFKSGNLKQIMTQHLASLSCCLLLFDSNINKMVIKMIWYHDSMS